MISVSSVTTVSRQASCSCNPSGETEGSDEDGAERAAFSTFPRKGEVGAKGAGWGSRFIGPHQPPTPTLPLAGGGSTPSLRLGHGASRSQRPAAPLRRRDGARRRRPCRREG